MATAAQQYSFNGEGQRVDLWARFDNAGAIADSYNVTSITDNGTGDFTVNFSVSLPSSNFGLGLGTSGGTGSQDDFTSQDYSDTNTASNIRLITWSRGSNAKTDPSAISVTAIG